MPAQPESGDDKKSPVLRHWMGGGISKAAGGAWRSAVYPQHSFRARALETDGMPGTGVSVTSVTPVSWKSEPGMVCGLPPVLANATTASIPRRAIRTGSCMAVAPIAPAATSRTPRQPPSTV